MNRDSVLKLQDGRQLGYAIYGNKSGLPITYCHGAPGSRLECHPDQSVLEALNICLIVPDRPGYGLSMPSERRSLLSWADDVQQLLDTLSIQDCGILGFSGGGPYAMACAYQLPERITHLGLVSCLAPFNNPHGTDGMNEQSKALYGLALSDPATFEAQIKMLATDGEVLFQIMTGGLPPEDQAVISLEGIKTMYLENMHEALRSGVDGIVSDMLIFPRDWCFSPSEIRCDTYLWQGGKDMNVPLHMGKWLAETIPSCDSFIIDDDAHFLLFTHWEEIFGKLLSKG